MSDTTADTISGASFSAMVPGPGTPPSPAYSDLVRLGAVDATDEPLLPVDPAKPTGTTFGDDSIPSPFSAGGLNYSIDTLQFVAPDAYLRVGEPGGYEPWLTTNADAPAAPTKPAAGASATPFGGNGIVLHSTDQISAFAPSITNTAATITNNTDSMTTYSGETFSVVYTGDHSIGVLSAQTKGAAGVLTNANYSVVNNLASVVGNSTTTVGGSMATVWAGADASTGIGSLLWSNFGVTGNLFGGSIVNIINGAVDLQGWGETKLSDFDVLAPETVSLAIAPIGGAATLASTVLKLAQRLALAGGIVNGALVAFMEAGIGAAADVIGKDEAKLKDDLDAFQDTMMVITALTAALQVACVAAGIALNVQKKLANALPAASIRLTNGSIVLSAGGTSVTIDGTGFNVNAGNPADTVLATTNMTTVTVDSAAVLAAQAPFVGAAAGTGTIQGAIVPPLPVKTITLSTMGPFQASATAVSFTLPT